MKLLASHCTCFSGKGRPFLERLRAQEEKDEVMQALDEYRKPRDALLILVSDYIRICAPRLQELEEALPPRHTVPELLDNISVNVRCYVSDISDIQPLRSELKKRPGNVERGGVGGSSVFEKHPKR